MEIFREFTFEAAHHLPNTPAGHKCRRLHGHSFRVQVCLQGPVDPRAGWVVDFDEVEKVCEPARLALDHYCLNDIPGLENPTSENIARWLWRRLKPKLPGLAFVKIWETCAAGCVYRGEDD